MYRKDIVIWFNTPPKVSKGAFNYLSRNWGQKVYYICNMDYPEYRKSLNWNDGDFAEAEIVILEKMDSKLNFIKTFFEEHPNAIHILPGFGNDIEKIVRPYILTATNPIVIFSERPVELGSIFERFLRLLYFKIKYSHYYNLYKSRISVFLPLGMKGLKTFAKYGWPEEKMLPFMYNPEGNLIEDKYLTPKGKSNTIKFLYVGRFYYRTKGVDVLMKAVKYLYGNWSLDLVGGYGDKAKEVRAWIEKTPNVNFLGSWPSEEVSHRMSQYDVVIVPSKYDGWNLLVNEAINAGVGVIVSDQAVSDEVIKYAHAGAVFMSNKPKALAKEMQRVIDNPWIANEWHIKAINASKSISPEIVGDYLISVLDYFIYGRGVRPICPWLITK